MQKYVAASRIICLILHFVLVLLLCQLTFLSPATVDISLQLNSFMSVFVCAYSCTAS